MPTPSVIGFDFVINVDSTRNQTDAHILQRSDGGALVYWTAAGAASPIQGRLITPTGGLIGNPFNASLDISFNLSGNVVAADLPNGGFVFAANTSSSVQLRTFDATGLEGVGSVASLNVTVNGGLVMETLADGRIATFISTSSGELFSFGTVANSSFDNLSLNNGSGSSTHDQGGGNWNVIDAAGIGSTAMALATTRSNGTQVDLHIVSAASLADTSGPISVPVGAGFVGGTFKLTEMSSGNFIASWRSGNTLDAQQYNASGQVVGPLMQTVGTSPVHLSVTPLPTGQFLMTWDDGTATDHDIYAQLFTAGGVADGSKVLVNYTVTGDQTDPSAAVLTNGSIVTIYDSVGGGTQDTLSRSLSLTRPDAVNDYAPVGAGHASVLNLLSNDHDPNNDSISISFVNAPSHGTTTLTNGVVSYMPNPGYAGTDVFTYRISNSHGETDTAAVLVNVQRHPASDFDGDGRSDILWRNDNGQFGDWLGNASGGFAYNGAAGLSPVTTDWHIAGTGDFNGDGRSDLLWRNDNGQVVDWLASGGGGLSYNSVAGITAVSNDWHIAGIGDFNGDGRADLLWRNDSGVFGDWLANTDGSLTYNTAVGVVAVSNDWHIVATADFNADGRADLLWRNDDGSFGDWLGQANGGFAYNSAAGVTAVSNDWHIVGTGDFNGDGRSDLLWRNDNGSFGDWLGQPNGGFAYNGAAGITQVPTDWHIAAIGDYNGDGRDDIMWRHDSGTFGDWLATANGGFAYNAAAGLTSISNDWHIQSNLLLI